MKAFYRITFLFIILFSVLNDVKSQTIINVTDTLQIDDKTYRKVESEASFPGGPAAWSKYISKYIQNNIDSFRKRDYGTCIVRFIVGIHGSISDVEATNMKKSRLAKIVVEAIENGPKWIPAQQNGRPVNAYRLQPVTLTNPGK